MIPQRGDPASQSRASGGFFFSSRSRHTRYWRDWSSDVCSSDLVETRDAAGRLDGIRVRRLKEKLGTRKLPTAELELDGTPARMVAEPGAGVRAIAPMLNVTRTWNAVSAAAYMRRGVALARDYARRRSAFDAPLSRQPLHLDTLAGLQAELEGAMHLTFRLVELLGRAEAEGADEGEARLLRVLTALAKLTTGRQAVAVGSERLRMEKDTSELQARQYLVCRLP